MADGREPLARAAENIRGAASEPSRRTINRSVFGVSGSGAWRPVAWAAQGCGFRNRPAPPLRNDVANQ